MLIFLGCAGWLLITCSPIGFNSEQLHLVNDLDDTTLFSEEKLFHSLLKQAGCQDFHFYVWNYVYKIVSIEGGNPPPYYTVKEKIMKRVQEEVKGRQVSEDTIKNFAKQFVKIYAYVTEFMQNTKQGGATEVLVQLEHKAILPEHIDLANKLHTAFTELNHYAKAIGRKCFTPPILSTANVNNEPDDSHGIQLFHSLKQKHHPLIYGALKVMSTAYQSCSTLKLPLMPLEYETEGVSIYATHPGNPAGSLREIFDLQAVIQSHYYISQIQRPDSNFCFNVRATPMIYDFGGKPAPHNTSINLFKDSGRGSTVLGLDCSGFAATSMAVAGLRFKHNMPIRPIHVQGINANMFKNAEQYQLSCLKKQDISLYNPLQPGDIIASSDHVAIVDQVGEDPFHIHSVHHSSGCHLDQLKTNRFNFSIIQSSAHNTVGINRMHIAHAFDQNSNFGWGLQQIASRLCYQKFGINAHDSINKTVILRHLDQEPACRNKEIHLTHQECLNSCSPVNPSIEI